MLLKVAFTFNLRCYTLAQQAGFVPSQENLDFVMEHDALGHVVMDQVQGHEAGAGSRLTACSCVPVPALTYQC
jgi:hypothetical protein